MAQTNCALCLAVTDTRCMSVCPNCAQWVCNSCATESGVCTHCDSEEEL